MCTDINYIPFERLQPTNGLPGPGRDLICAFNYGKQNMAFYLFLIGTKLSTMKFG